MNVERVRQEFPILNQVINDHPLVYLDNAATSQKPQCVIDRLVEYYTSLNANVHRGTHTLSERATKAYENSRKAIQRFINAKKPEECVFVRGTTEAINLVAETYGRSQFHAGDEVIITTMEHHSNIVPWQFLRESLGIVLKVIPINEAGELDFEAFTALLSARTKLVSISHVSNSLGTINPIKQFIDAAHAQDVPVLIDGAQATSHIPVDVQALDCDFYCISGHKAFAPTGIGVLYAKEHLLKAMPPYQGGGEMIRQVSFDSCSFNDIPLKFEAGTPNIAGAIAFHAAIDFINELGFDAIIEHEQALLRYATETLLAIPDFRLYGTAKEKVGILSFLLGDIHPHDLGTICNQYGVAIRTGRHCTMPLMTHFNITGTARASLCVFNTREDIDTLVKSLDEARRLFA